MTSMRLHQAQKKGMSWGHGHESGEKKESKKARKGHPFPLLLFSKAVEQQKQCCHDQGFFLDPGGPSRRANKNAVPPGPSSADSHRDG